MKNLLKELMKLRTKGALSVEDQAKLDFVISSLANPPKTFLKAVETFSIPASPDTIICKETVQGLVAPVWERERKKRRRTKNPEPVLEDDVWEDPAFAGKLIIGTPYCQKMAVYIFLEDVYHSHILNAGERMLIKKVGTYLDALLTVLGAVMKGAVDKKDNGVIAYFKMEGGDQLYYFAAWRRYNGHLRIKKGKVDYDTGYQPGRGVCFLPPTKVSKN